MKKFFSVLVGLLIITALASAHLYVVTPKTGTQEYFGVNTRLIGPEGIKWLSGAVYAANDQLKFYFTSGSGFKFGTPTSTFYYLVGRSRTDLQLHADLNGNLANEWGIFSGGAGYEYVTFRLNDAYAPFMNPGTSWFLTTVANPGASAGAIYAKAPIAPAATLAGTEHKLTVDVSSGGTYFDNTPSDGVKFFTNYYEFVSSITKKSSKIDVALQRKGFDTAPIYQSGATDMVTTSRTGRDYSTALLGLLATDYFKHSVSGNMTGVSYARFYGTTNHPASSSSCIVNVPGTSGSLFAPTGSAYLVVTGTTTLDSRTVTDACEFAPNAAGNGFYGRSLYAATDAWAWDTNGTVFRTAYFTTATYDGIYSAFRFVNNAAAGTADAQVFADVWLDNGTQTTTSVQIGVIPAQGHLSLNGYRVAELAGLLPQATMAGGDGWKGRAQFTVWAPTETTFGVETTIMTSGYSTVPLEKMTMPSVAWWEK
jgi:hypothetical protein